MYILNILSVVKKMIVKEVKYFIFQNYYGRIGFTKKNSCHSIKHQKKKYLLATKSIKKYLMLVMLITQQPKPIENPNSIDIKSVTIEHPKTYLKFSKAIKHMKKFP